MEQKNYYQDLSAIYAEMRKIFGQMNLIQPESQQFIDALDEFHELLKIEKQKIINTITNELVMTCSYSFISDLKSAIGNGFSFNNKGDYLDHLAGVIFYTSTYGAKEKKNYKLFVCPSKESSNSKDFFAKYQKDFLLIDKLFGIKFKEYNHLPEMLSFILEFYKN